MTKVLVAKNCRKVIVYSNVFRRNSVVNYQFQLCITAGIYLFKVSNKNKGMYEISIWKKSTVKTAKRRHFGVFNCVCVKRITLCICLCSSSSSSPSRDFASVIRNIGKFGAKNYFTDHRTANTIYRFRDSVPVLKIHEC